MNYDNNNFTILQLDLVFESDKLKYVNTILFTFTYYLHSYHESPIFASTSIFTGNSVSKGCSIS